MSVEKNTTKSTEYKEIDPGLSLRNTERETERSHLEEELQFALPNFKQGNLELCDAPNTQVSSSPNTSGGSECAYDTCLEVPKGISTKAWGKFQELKERRELLKKKTTSARKRKFAANDDQYGGKKTLAEICEISQNPSAAVCSIKCDESWSKITQFIDVNKHLDGVDRGKYVPKSGLEESIDAAIARGDVETAEKLSDQMAVRQFGLKVASAIDASKYAEEMKRKEEMKKAQKKEKLQWGFEPKQRWETKGNM